MNELNHVGIIMDGNRRWAKKNNYYNQLYGHEKGTQKFMELCTWCLDRKIPYLSVYAFSTENWNRSEYEVNGIFLIFEKFFKERLKDCLELGIRISVIGNRARLKQKHRDIISDAEEATKNCSNLYVQVCLSYGGRDEITRAAVKIAEAVQNGTLAKNSITEDIVSGFLDTAGVPMVDMVIRTGGNQRLSNFLIWQSAYAEFYFTNTLWPDFGEEEFEAFIEKYHMININMGK